MTRFILAAGVAALAISAPATAERAGKSGDKPHASKAERGGGSKARSAKVERRSATKVRAARADGKPTRFASFEQRKDKSDRSEFKARGRDGDRIKATKQDRKDDRAFAKLRDRDDVRIRRDRDRDVVRVRDFDDDHRFDRRFAARYHGYGCPPGLAKRTPRCIPPGQAKKLVGQRLPSDYARSYMPDRLRSLYRDNDDFYYRYGDGYAYRVDRKTQLIASLLPLFGAGLGLGQVLPTTYSNSFVPSYYSSFYPDSRDNYYRYANGYVYGVDRGSGLIDQMIPLMAGGYGVGQMLPAGYSAYNVPYEYRDRYYDTNDNYYRYAPGAIYQVDPQTQLITGLASLLSPSGFSVGQSMPMGYSAYNVPYGYRDQYSDTADNWYRYNNGSIYQVDPTTQLITAIIRAVV